MARETKRHAVAFARCRAQQVLSLAPALLALGWAIPSQAQQLGDYSSHAAASRSVVITGTGGERIRITPYGDYIARVQVVRSGEDFYPDDRYEMVESHDWDGTLEITDGASALELATGAVDGLTVSAAKGPLRLSFTLGGQAAPVLGEQNGVSWSGNNVTESFTAPAADEHFAGLGHEAYGRIERLDRRGTSVTVGHGSEGACVVPFYLSSRGYGVFLNTTFTHTINLGQNNTYSLGINGEGYGGQMDYFFIAGPDVAQILDRYTQLTGRPRMPQRSIFGLQLSDKSDPSNNGEAWWKQMITDHRNAGFAFDHQVNDNAWRASNEATSGQMNSWFEFRADRFPDPAEYQRWAAENGVTVTLDLNRPGIPLNPSWNDAYSIPGTNDCPDFTNPAAADWIWNLFFDKALDPALGYPGDAIWLDEFDYPDHNHSTTLASGKRWAEESINYHFDLLRACVDTGWDPAIGEAKRPYFWSRGITAGAQRWGTHWTGDLDGNWGDMAYQVKAMQSAGISGFPYFNHDAGAHFTPTVNEDNLYRQWDMAFGSFTPIWKPHGPGHKRWPLQRNTTCQSTARTYITNRYQMMPYIYSYAHLAQQTGLPMARPMFFEHQNDAAAWGRDMQYFWGHEMVVAPNCSDGNNTVSVWLPPGNWYDFWDDTRHAGDTTEDVNAATGELPVFVREGAIIPMAPYATSTFFIPQDQLIVHAYAGADGTFALYEDDGVTERFRTQGELRRTNLRLSQQDLVVEIGVAAGTYSGAPTSRSYQVVYHGLSAAPEMYVNGTPVPSHASEDAVPAGQDGAVWDAGAELLTVFVAARPVDETTWIASAAEVTLPGTGGTGGNGGSQGGDAGAPGAAGMNVGGTATGGVPGAGGAAASGGTTAAGGTVDGGVPAAGGVTGSGGVSAGGTTTAAGGSTLPGAGGTGGAACSAPLTLCGTACVDLAADAANCGQCGTSCAVGQVCAAGACAATCPPGQTQCGQACFDLTTHLLNCGACGNACPLEQICQAGLCSESPAGGGPTVPSAAADREATSDSGCGCATPLERPMPLGGLMGMLLGLAMLERRRLAASPVRRPRRAAGAPSRTAAAGRGLAGRGSLA
ncbi:MAG: DUF5110 domain-containing protein [Polyangiaceae bacterium]|nr:DUF5110 domain-containing protein [Polyangiaceae bacterium]